MAPETAKPVPQLTARKLNRARGLIKEGKIIAGLKLFEEIIEFDPRSGYVWLDYADALTDVHRFKDALTAYEQALRFAPESKKCFVLARIGILLEESKSIADAEKYFRLAMDSLSEPAAWVQILYGKNLAVQGRYEEAEKVLLDAAGLESAERDEAYLNLAILYRCTARYDESREMAAKALEINPQYSAAKKLIGSLKLAD